METSSADTAGGNVRRSPGSWPDSKIAAKQMIQLVTRTLGVAGILCLPLVAVGADYHEGLAAHRRGDYEAALAEWRPLAAQGDAESQYRIARMYHHGEGEKDDAAAANWYRKAAEQEHGKAQNNLGLLYEEVPGPRTSDACVVLCPLYFSWVAFTMAAVTVRSGRQPGNNGPISSW